MGAFSSNFRLIGCDFASNRARDGGVLAGYQGSVFFIDNARFSNNSGEQVGGVLYLEDSCIEISNSQFMNNEARYGGVGGAHQTILRIHGSYFDKNSAKFRGGVLHIDYCNITVSASQFTNSMTFCGPGGALSVERSTVISIYKTNFSSNSAKSEGGGLLLLEQNHLYVTQSQFTDNSCLLYTSPSPRDATLSRMPSSA